MQNILSKATFGTINDYIDNDTAIGIELKTSSRLYISEIACSFRLADGETQSSQPFRICRLFVFKKRLNKIPINAGVYDDTIKGDELIFEKFIYSYEGFEKTFSNLYTDDEISVVVCPVQIEGEANPVVFASLTVAGSEGGNSNVKLQTV